jgi:hypothetical protein
LNKELVETTLGHPLLIDEILFILLNTKSVTVMQAVLQTIYSLLCCDCYTRVIVGLGEKAGSGFLRLIELIEETNEMIATFALCILLQLCVYESGREALICANASKYLIAIVQPPASLRSAVRMTSHYNRTSSQRAAAVMAAMCRQVDRITSYDPEETPRMIASNPNFLRLMTYFDLLYEMKIRSAIEITSDILSPALAVPIFDKTINWTVNDLNCALVQLINVPWDDNAAADLSFTADDVGSRNLADFITREGDSDYFSTLNMTEIVSVSEILAGMSSNRLTARSMFSAGTIVFLGRCISMAKQSFLGPGLADDTIQLLLHGVSAAAIAMQNLCFGCVGHVSSAEELIQGVHSSHFVDSSIYFMHSLTKQSNATNLEMLLLPFSLKNVLKDVGMSVVKAFDGYASLLLSLPQDRGHNLILQLKGVGNVVTKVRFTCQKIVEEQ